MALTIRPTLLLTHPTLKLRKNAELCATVWRRPDFAKRLSLHNGEEARLPQGIREVRGRTRIMYSYDGSLNHPPVNGHGACLALDEGFAGLGDQVVVSGGGFVDTCQLKTFISLVEIKRSLREVLQVLMPLPLIYTYRHMSIIDYVRSSDNDYAAYLRSQCDKRLIDGYRITLDCERLLDEGGGHPTVEQHWFTSPEKMFASPFFG